MSTRLAMAVVAALLFGAAAVAGLSEGTSLRFTLLWFGLGMAALALTTGLPPAEAREWSDRTKVIVTGIAVVAALVVAWIYATGWLFG